MESRISVAAHMHMPLTVATTAAEFGGADPAASIVNRHQSLAGKTMLHVQRSPLRLSCLLEALPGLCGISQRLYVVAIY